MKKYQEGMEERRVLIVDDDKGFSRGIVDILETAGYRTIIAHSKQKAFEIAKNFKAQIALINMKMLKNRCVAFIPELKKIVPDIVCLIMGVAEEVESVIEALQEDVYDYLIKPFSSRVLLSRLDQCYEKIRFQREKLETDKELKKKNRELEEINARQRKIVESIRVFTGFTDLHKVAPLILKEFAKNMAADGGSLFFCEQNKLVCAHTLDNDHVPEHIELPLPRGSIFYRAIEKKVPILIRDVSDEKRISRSGWKGYKNNSVLVFPLKDENDQVKGLISLHNKKYPPFTPQDRDLGLILCSFTYEAIRATEASEKLRESNELLQKEIRERMKAEEGIIKNEKFLNSMFNAIHDGVSVLDPQLTIRKVNTWMQKMYASQAPLIGKKCYEVYQQRSSPCPWCPSLRTLQTGGVHSEIVPYPSLHDPQGWIDLSTYPLKDDEGKVVAIIEHVKDITERKKAEDLLRHEKEKAQRYLDVAGVMILVIDRDGSVKLINKKGCEILGYSEQEILGKNWFSTFIPAQKQRIEKETFRQIMSGKKSQVGSYESSIINNDGEERIISWHRTVLHDEKTNITGMICSGEDITKRKQVEKALKESEQQLRQSQKMEAIGRLAGGIAHDFNNLLMAIIGYAEMLISNPNIDTAIRDYAAEIISSSERASSLTQQLLAFSRKQVLKPKILNLNILILELRNMLQRIIGEDIRLETCMEPSLGVVKIDPNQIEQIIINLVVNSRDAMPKGGTLTIQTSNVFLDESFSKTHAGLIPGHYVMLLVRDTGHGMDEHIKSKIFEPFFTTKEKGKGTGLGLSTVYGIVKQSGGYIWVDSEVDMGTTVKIYFPLIESVEKVRETEEKIYSTKTGNETILLVEDEKVVRNMLSACLKKLGYSVYEAEGGHSALSLCDTLADKGLDLLITDVVMPDINGHELAEELVKKYPHLRVLYMSGYTDDAIVHHGILEEGIPFIQKPFTLDMLAARVREVMDKDKFK